MKHEAKYDFVTAWLLYTYLCGISKQSTTKNMMQAFINETYM